MPDGQFQPCFIGVIPGFFFLGIGVRNGLRRLSFLCFLYPLLLSPLFFPVFFLLFSTYS
jgi:hypothetical protein